MALSPSSNKEDEEELSSDDNTFRLDDEYLRREIDGKGAIRLPKNKGIRNLILDVEENEAVKVVRLILKGNPVAQIKGAEKLVNLNWLSCEGCVLDAVPKGIDAFPAVEEITFRSNDIKEIPLSLWHLPSLRRLHLSENKNLEQIPNLTDNLTSLYLNDCNLKSLPSNFFHHRLEGVDLRNNKGESRKQPSIN